MEWSRSETLALALNDCAGCLGSGLQIGRSARPCNCVLRSIFRICWGRFEWLVKQDPHQSRVSLPSHVGRARPSWGRKNEEFIADFWLVTRRTLTEPELKLFRYHFLLGADWKLCGRKLGVDRGNFFHAVYRIEQKLGRTFRELRPYPLFPLDDYFNGPSVFEQARPTISPMGRSMPARLNFPMAAGALPG